MAELFSQDALIDFAELLYPTYDVKNGITS